MLMSLANPMTFIIYLLKSLYQFHLFLNLKAFKGLIHLPTLFRDFFTLLEDIFTQQYWEDDMMMNHELINMIVKIDPKK